MIPSYRLDELIRDLGELSEGEIAELFQESLRRKAAEAAKKAAGKSSDPIGTIRYDADGDPSALWVRDSEKGWEPFFEDDHGLGIEDHHIKWREFPKVGMMPADWIAKYEEYDRLDRKI